MLFDCVRVNTGLGFHWIWNSEIKIKKGEGYMWFDDVINLEPFFSFWPVGCFWLVKTYQYGWHPSVLSHHALETVECDESYCYEYIFGRRGAGNSFTMRHTATRRSSWPYMDFNFFVTSVPGVGGGGMPLYDIWAGSIHIWVPPPLHGFLGWLEKPHTLLLPCINL
jgi:hypothetical protein